MPAGRPKKVIPEYHTNLTLKYLEKYAVGDTFVETGTYQGDAVVLAKLFGFKTIHSIEVDHKLSERAYTKFQHDPSIHIWQGNSLDVLDQIFTVINPEICTFWLDAHANGNPGGSHTVHGSNRYCPLLEELKYIASLFHKNHTIFIDDRRLFGDGIFSHVTEGDVMSWLLNINPNYKIGYLNGHIENDIIVAYMESKR